MKKIIYLLGIILFISCKQQVKDFAVVSGTFTNKTSDSLIIKNSNFYDEKYYKKIDITEEGSFSDTLRVTPGVYLFVYRDDDYSLLYLENGFDLNIDLVDNDNSKSITIKGKGEKINNSLRNYSIEYNNIMDELENLALEKIDRVTFEEKLNSSFSDLNLRIDNMNGIDSTFVRMEKNWLDYKKDRWQNEYEYAQHVPTMYGKDSPKFTNYENYAGGELSLDDFKGKYVYIDIWATWCGPCLDELPLLKEVEKEYHDKNIEFVSISIDRLKNYKAWKKMVKEKNLSGIQLYAKEDKSFIEAYKVNGIPRFILLDPNGKIITPDAPRPSERSELKKLLDEI